MAQVIINSLHSLITHSKLGKVFKTLNLFMDSYDGQIRDNIATILATYQPSNDLEKLIRVRLIDRYRCYDEVLNILKSEDSFYITHILQCYWFFENSDFEPKLFVDDVLPYMSYSTRFKVLKKYSKLLGNSKIAASFFNHTKQRYGLRTALILLPACNENFVKNILETISIQVPLSVLLALLDGHPSVVMEYLNQLLENASKKKRVCRAFTFYNYEKLFISVAMHAPQEFAVLMEKYHRAVPYMRLGRRSTKRLVFFAFDSIKKNINIYKRILNWKFVVRCLRLDQISELQFALLPKTMSEFFQLYNGYCEFVEVTSSLKENVSREILISNFNKAYNKPVIDYLDVMSLDLVTMLPTESKESWVDSKLPEIDNPEKKIKYIVQLPCKKSLPMLKKLIEGQAEVNIRSKIVNGMFKTIMINGEEELIGDISQFIVKRLRNDRTMIRDNAISELVQYKHLIDISDACWEPIEELINIMMINNELSGSCEDVIKIISTQIHSRLKRNLPVADHLERLLKISGDNYSFNLCKDTQYEKQCLKWFLDNFREKNLYPTKKVTNENEKNSILPVNLFIRLCNWNAYHKNDRIDVPDWLNKLIEQLFNKEGNDYRKKLILEAVKKDESLKHNMYSKIFPNYIDFSVLIFKLHQDPELVRNHAVDILKKIRRQSTKSYYSFFKQAKLYPASNLPDNITGYCLKILKEEANEDEGEAEADLLSAKRDSILVLSLMLPTYKFVEIVANFYPKQSVIDDYSDEGRELFQIQSQISACLKYVDSPSEILESLSKFAVGDYLKLVVGSLNSVCLRTPEYKILPLLKEWLDCPVSLRKHFFRAYFKIAPISSTLEMLLCFFENEKNISLRLLLFENALRFFVKEPSSETFCVLKAVLGKIQSSDEGFLNKLFHFENIPNEFISEYIQVLWDVINLKNEASRKSSRDYIIRLIEPDILYSLSDDFCDVLLTEVFNQDFIDTKLFAARYLLCSRSVEQFNRRIKNVMSKIEVLVKSWNEFDLKADKVFNCRSTISFFVDSLIRESFSINCEALPTHELIEKVKFNLLNSFQESEILEEILLLEISAFFLTTPDNSELIYHFSKFIEPIADKMVASYGNELIVTISSAVKKVLAWKYLQVQDNTQDIRLIQFSEILLKSHSTNCFIIGLKMLPAVITSDSHKYRHLLTFILQNPEPTVKPFVNKLFKELSSSLKVE